MQDGTKGKIIRIGDETVMYDHEGYILLVGEQKVLCAQPS